MYKMMWCQVMVLTLLCLKIYFGLECPSETISGFRFNLYSRRNTTGHWTAKVEHNGEDDKEIGPWDLEVGHRRKKCVKSESVFVDVTITAAMPVTETPPENVTVLDGKDTTMVCPAIGAPAPNITSTNQGTPTEEKRVPLNCPPAPEGYELVDGLGYYKFHERRKTWQEAIEACAQEGAHMMVINSEEEANAVDSMIEIRENNNFFHWVGIHDMYTEGNFVTIFNETAASTGYYKWGENQRDGGKRTNCGAYIFKRGLYDWFCSYAQPFICEVPLCEIK